MVQLAPNLTLTLKSLASQGAVVSHEQQAAMDYSLPIKRAEAGLKTLTLWGKIIGLNGKDYLIAEGVNDPIVKAGAVNFEAKYYFSQDGVKWNDLQSIDADAAAKAGKVKGQLSGDASKVYEFEEKVPPPPPAEVPEGAEAPPPEEPTTVVIQVPELAVLRLRIDAINGTTGVIPVNSVLVDASNCLVPNRMFNGSGAPDKLESYTRRTVPPGGPTLAADLRGTWAVQSDPFRGVTVLRSLLFPGYFFYFSSLDLVWGSLYCGDGVRNNDLVFLL